MHWERSHWCFFFFCIPAPSQYLEGRFTALSFDLMFELFLSLVQRRRALLHTNMPNSIRPTHRVFTSKTALAPTAPIFWLRVSNSSLWIEGTGWHLKWNFTGTEQSQVHGGSACVCVVCACTLVHVSRFIHILSVEPYESVIAVFSSHPNHHSSLLLICSLLSFLCKGPENAPWVTINEELCGESY